MIIKVTQTTEFYGHLTSMHWLINVRAWLWCQCTYITTYPIVQIIPFTFCLHFQSKLKKKTKMVKHKYSYTQTQCFLFRCFTKQYYGLLLIVIMFLLNIFHLIIIFITSYVYSKVRRNDQIVHNFVIAGMEWSFKWVNWHFHFWQFGAYLSSDFAILPVWTAIKVWFLLSRYVMRTSSCCRVIVKSTKLISVEVLLLQCYLKCLFTFFPLVCTPLYGGPHGQTLCQISHCIYPSGTKL